MTSDATAVAADLAPTGVLRAVINRGNPILVPPSPGDEPGGVTVDIARELGRRLGVPVELISVDTAGKAFEAVTSGQADVCFLAIEPARGDQVLYSGPYVILEAVYAVPEGSSIGSAEEVDRPGVRIGITGGSAYELYLSRSLQHAQLERSADGEADYLERGLDAVAGLRPSIEQLVLDHPGHRVLEPPFTGIRQAAGIRSDSAPVSQEFLREVVEELRASGFIADSLRRSGQPVSLVAREAR